MYTLIWYREQISRHGPMKATATLFRTLGSRAIVRLMNTFGPARVSCPCCGWEGNRFSSYIEDGVALRNAECPRCNSHARHRALMFWLQNQGKSWLTSREGLGLIFAPERALTSAWDSSPQLRIIRIDYARSRGVDLQGDIQRLPLATNCIDVIWCHHVLEHVCDDNTALREMFRVLRAGTGELIVSVPTNSEPLTQEYGAPNPCEFDHWRTYGLDFPEKLRRTGFRVIPLDLGLTHKLLCRHQVSVEPVFRCIKPVPHEQSESRTPN